jgi:hypothetical protein
MKTGEPTAPSFGLLDLLTRLGHEELQNLACRFGLVGSSPSRRTLSSKVLAKYRDPGFIGDIVRSLNQPESDLLRLIVLLQDHLERGVRWPLGIIPSDNVTSSVSTFETLVESGLVFRHPEERSRVLIPTEIASAIREALLSNETSRPLTEEESVWGGTERILWMLFRLLVAAYLGRLRQTQGETFVKRDLDTWYSSLPSDLFPPASLPHTVEISNVAGFLLSVGKGFGLIDIEGGSLHTTEQTCLWLRQPRQALLRHVWTIFLERVAIKYPDWYRFLFRVVYGPGQGRPSFDGFRTPPFDRLRTPLWDISPPGGTGARCSLAIWLSWFGLVRVVREGSRVVAVRTPHIRLWDSPEETSSEGAPSTGTLQPNFELMVPPDTPLGTLWEIERFADHHRTDVVSIYLLSRQSIIRGLRDNLSREEIWDRLSQITAGRIPQNVRFSLEEWFDSFGRVQVDEVILLRCRTAEVAEEILHISEANEAIRERLAPTILVADRSRINSLLDTLERLGFAPLVLLTGAGKERSD